MSAVCTMCCMHHEHLSTNHIKSRGCLQGVSLCRHLMPSSLLLWQVSRQGQHATGQTGSAPLSCTACSIAWLHTHCQEEEEAHRREVDSVPWNLAVVKDNHPVMAAIQSCHLWSRYVEIQLKLIPPCAQCSNFSTKACPAALPSTTSLWGCKQMSCPCICMCKLVYTGVYEHDKATYHQGAMERALWVQHAAACSVRLVAVSSWAGILPHSTSFCLVLPHSAMLCHLGTHVKWMCRSTMTH